MSFDNETRLLNTSLTWATLAQSLQRNLRTNALLCPSSTITPFESNKDSNVKLGLLHLEWYCVDPDNEDSLEGKGDQFPEDSHLPKQAILKITDLFEMSMTFDESISLDGQVALLAKEKQVHNNETNLYNYLKTVGANFEELKIATPLAVVPVGEETNLGFTCTTVVEKSLSVHAFNNLTVEEAKQVIFVLAKLQAVGIKNNVHEADPFDNSIFVETNKETTSRKVLDGLFEELQNIDFKKYEETIKKGKSLPFWVYNFNTFDQIQKELHIEQRVINHGNMCSSNILWKTVDGNRVFEALTGWQKVHLGNPAEDLVRFISTSLSGKERRSSWEKLLEYFYFILLGELGENVQAPYTLEQLKESFRCLLPTSSVSLLGRIAPQFKVAEKQTGDGLHRTRVNCLAEKAQCLIEDAVSFAKQRIEKLSF